MSQNRKDTLFLHMGPGFSCYVENKVLGPSFPRIDFWDQPIIHDSANAFLTLAEEAKNRIEFLQNNNGSLINVKAHSFGGHIIDYLMKTKSVEIASCEIYNTSFNMNEGYLNLLSIMSKHPSTEEKLKLRMNDFLSSNINSLTNSKIYESVISLISEDPLFLKHYFLKPQKFESYLSIAQHAPPFDLVMFKNVLVDFMDNYFDPDFSYNKENMTIYLNKDDPFYTEKSETLWQTRYPSAKIFLTDKIGHFIPLQEYL